MINVNLLRSKIYEKYKSQAEFSRSINWNVNKINKILNNLRIPDVNECAEICKTLSLTAEEYVSIFMPSLSPNGVIKKYA